jgi:exodeoxyribonuclease-1
VDASLYDGFLNDHDRALGRRINGATPAELAEGVYDFHDERLSELFFRYRARNWPESLSPADRELWREHCQMRYEDENRGLGGYFERVAELREACADNPAHVRVLDELERWGDGLLAGSS